MRVVMTWDILRNSLGGRGRVWNCVAEERVVSGSEGEGVELLGRTSWRGTGKKAKRELFLREKIVAIVIINIYNTVLPILFLFGIVLTFFAVAGFCDYGYTCFKEVL